MTSEHGYKTYGIEICDSQIEEAKVFSEKHNLELNITKGDMRKLPFEDESISYVYSYNSIFHMKKEDIAKSISEIKVYLIICTVSIEIFRSESDHGIGALLKVSRSHIQVGNSHMHIPRLYPAVEIFDR
jgi:hypothetical protein